MQINEIAARLGITPRAIRLYETKGLLTPLRGKENKYRHFSAIDAWRLQTIAALRGVGLGLEQIKALMERLDRGDSATVHHYLELQRMALTSKWVEEKYALTMLDKLISRLEAKGQLDTADYIRQQQASWIDTWQFDTLAAHFDRDSAMLSTGPELSQAEYEHVLDLIVQWTAPRQGEAGLDVGAGTGNLAGLLTTHGAHMSAVDQSKEMLAKCRDKHPAVAAKLGNALALPFIDERFSLIVSAFAFHFLNGQQQRLALEEMERVLTPNGRICIAGLMTEDETAEAKGKSQKHLIYRPGLTAWFQEHDFITVHYAINPEIGVLYAVRKY